MFVEAFVDKDLGNSAYLVGSHETKNAVLVDPLRDVDRYLAVADRLGVRLTHVLETHLHADFISGARELAARSGVTIAASAEAGLGFDHLPLEAGAKLPVGELLLSVLRTPGHTPEHISFLAEAPDGAGPPALLSGGALIVGGVARTDLLGHDLSEPLARRLYHTVHHTLLALPDDVGVFPTHGTGSFCAAPPSAERTTTIGRERRMNPLAKARDEEEFVRLALAGLPTYPTYFAEMRAINQRGPRVLGGIPDPRPLSAHEVRRAIDRGIAVLDVRPAPEFARGHIPGSYGIAIEAPLTVWAGWLIPFGTPLVLVTSDDRECAAAVHRLIRIGYDRFEGRLDGGLAAWEDARFETRRYATLSPHEIHARLRAGNAPVLIDVRQDVEWRAGHIEGARHIENGALTNPALDLPRDREIALHCQHGERSVAGLSVLERRGYRDLTLVEGGLSAWIEAGFDVARDAG